MERSVASRRSGQGSLRYIELCLSDLRAATDTMVHSNKGEPAQSLRRLGFEYRKGSLGWKCCQKLYMSDKKKICIRRR